MYPRLSLIRSRIGIQIRSRISSSSDGYSKRSSEGGGCTNNYTAAMVRALLKAVFAMKSHSLGSRALNIHFLVGVLMLALVRAHMCVCVQEGSAYER